MDGKDLGDLGAFKLSSEFRVSFRLSATCLCSWFLRPEMVHVPKDGSCTISSIRACYGVDGYPGVCSGRSWRRIVEFR